VPGIAIHDHLATDRKGRIKSLPLLPLADPKIELPEETRLAVPPLIHFAPQPSRARNIEPQSALEICICPPPC